MWDVGDPSATPEEFAKVTCKDLKLPSSCIPEIAYQIREQVLQLKKAGKKGSDFIPQRVVRLPKA